VKEAGGKKKLGALGTVARLFIGRHEVVSGSP